jgi:hypothetical protein
MSQNFKTHQYQYSQEMRKRDCTPMHDSEFKTKNAKNHAISLLQMQGFPQSNIKQEINFFVSKIAKSNSKST